LYDALYDALCDALCDALGLQSGLSPQEAAQQAGHLEMEALLEGAAYDTVLQLAQQVHSCPLLSTMSI